MISPGLPSQSQLAKKLVDDERIRFIRHDNGQVEAYIGDDRRLSSIAKKHIDAAKQLAGELLSAFLFYRSKQPNELTTDARVAAHKLETLIKG
jgi:hypothetical protein